MKYPVLPVVIASLLVAIGLLWRNFGKEVSFSLPSSVVVTEGSVPASREIRFLRHWPIFGWYSPRNIEPSLQTGVIIQVKLNSPEITEWGWSYSDKKFRVEKQGDDKIMHTYFFHTDKVVKGAKQATLRIKSNNSQPSDATHQEDWYWVREFYDCEVISVS